MKKAHTTCISIMLWLISNAQVTHPLSLDECYELAQSNYPLAKQKALIEKSKEYNIENLKMGYLPQISFTAQATYQSDVAKITLPDNLPFPIHITPPSKDQYKMYGEVSQSFTDAVHIEPQRKLAANSAEIEQQKLSVELYKLKERVNQLFFGVLLIDGQLQQTELLKKDIQTGIDKISAAIANGLAYKSNRSELQAELLKAEQHRMELQAARKAYIVMLAQFINKELAENTTLQTPVNVLPQSVINRPELSVFDLQKKTFDYQNKLIVAKTIPKVGAFFQGGYAKPGLNMLKNEFAGYYYLGVRLGWSLSGFYTFSKDKKLLHLSSSMLDLQREAFLFNTQFSLTQQNAEVQKLQELIKTDDEIIELRAAVKTAAQAQLENGVITSNDYLLKANAEDQARQNKIIHRIQLLAAEYNHKTTSGN